MKTPRGIVASVRKSTKSGQGHGFVSNGYDFVIGERGGKRALIVRDAQHEYVFLTANGPRGSFARLSCCRLDVDIEHETTTLTSC